MSNELQPWEERMKEMAQASASTEAAGAGNYISLRNGIMKYMDEPLPGNELFAIVLSSAGEHTYYTERFDSERIVPPKCFAVYPMDEQEPKPHETVPDEQKQSDICRTCWAHKFKSADNGRGRACAVRRRLTLVAASDLDNLAKAEIASLRVPPTSVNNWGKYVNRVAAQHQRPPFMVVTRLFLEPHTRFQFTLDFEVSQLVEGEKFDQLMELRQASEAALMQPFDLTPPDEEDDGDDSKVSGKKRSSKK